MIIVDNAEKKVGEVMFMTDFRLENSREWWAVKSDKPTVTVTAIDSNTPNFQLKSLMRTADVTVTVDIKTRQIIIMLTLNFEPFCVLSYSMPYIKY